MHTISSKEHGTAIGGVGSSERLFPNNPTALTSSALPTTLKTGCYADFVPQLRLSRRWDASQGASARLPRHHHRQGSRPARPGASPLLPRSSR